MISNDSSQTANSTAEENAQAAEMSSGPAKTGSFLLKFFFGLLLLMIICLAIVLATLSSTLPKVASHFLKDYDIDLTIGKMDLRLLDGTLDIDNLSLGDINSSEALTIKELNVAVDLEEAIRNKNIIINTVSISDVEIPISHTLSPGKADQITIAGIDPERFASQEAKPKETTEANKDSIAFAWDSITLDDINLLYTRISAGGDASSTNIKAILHSLAVGSFSSTDTRTPTSIQAQLTAADIQSSFAGSVAPLDNGKPGHITAKLANIDLAQLKELLDDLAIELPAQASGIEGMLDYEGRIDWWITDARMFINLQSSELNANKFYMTLANKVGGNGKTSVVQSINGDFKLLAEKIKVGLNPTHIIVSNFDSQDSTLNYIDKQLNPKAEIKLKNINLAIDALDTFETKKSSALNFNAKMGDFGKLSVKGQLALLDPKSSGDLVIQGEQLNLTGFSGFSNAAIGKRIKKGALDFNINALISNGLIDSKVNLEAHQLGFAGLSAEQKATKAAADLESNKLDPSDKKPGFETELGMPLNTALNLLRDKDDTIRLKIPVKGPVDDPNININSIINKAIFKTFKSAVFTQLGPLMALSAFDKMKSFSDAAKLKPVTFAPMQNDLVAEEMAVIDKLAKFLAKRERIKLNICGVASSSEASATDESVKQTEKATDSDELLALADARAVFAKNHLIEKGIDGKRLILCAAEIDSSEAATPRVDFSL